MPRPTRRKRSGSARIAEGQSKRLHFNTEQPVARQHLPLGFSAVHCLKPFTATCPKCSAKHWIEERTTNSSIQNPQFSMCCANGKVSLQAPVYPPPELARYLLDQSQGKCAEYILLKMKNI